MVPRDQSRTISFIRRNKSGAKGSPLRTDPESMPHHGGHLLSNFRMYSSAFGHRSLKTFSMFCAFPDEVLAVVLIENSYIHYKTTLQPNSHMGNVIKGAF